MSWSSRLLFALALFTASVTRLAAADEVDVFASSRTALDEQRYDDARMLVKEDLASPRGARRAPALEITATAYLLEGRAAEGEPYVHALYELAPAFRLEDPALPPRVTASFAAEAGRFHGRRVPLAFRRDGLGWLLESAQQNARLEVDCRPRTAGPNNAFEPLRLVHGHFDLPGNHASACVALAFDEEGLALGRLGSKEAPVILEPKPSQTSTGVLGRWWFWTAVGAAVVGGIVLGVVETRTKEVTAPQADFTTSARSFRF